MSTRRFAPRPSPSVDANRARPPRPARPGRPRRADPLDLGLRLLEVASSGERRSTWSSHRSATTFDWSPSDHADVARHTGPAAVEPLEREDRVGRLEDRVVALLRFDAGVRRAPSIVIVRSVIPFRDETMSPFARAPSSTKAASCAGASSRITGPDHGEPISSSGLHVRDRAERVETDVLEHVGREEPREQAGLHVGHPGPTARSPSIRNGRSATVPSSKTVSMWPTRDVRTTGPAGACPSRGHRAEACRRARGARPPSRDRGTVARTGPRSRSRRSASTSHSRR